ncbi:Protein N-acetyltransferase, RimJ/RimL family [Bifidobacterium bohemicum]|uniref:Serine O-acetyltransferase CysE n=1 Tax=Bifidobacterium bohemicum DSM 22767 TaxID=1437606 RepID=A0A086ZFZ8_9BIFI|nr:GNAT family protein [Bifidobacterium bohemicum]KFI45448.1 serine O-acetyltransferase CysE [Bifidobacterium bohemicum DSM 22767]SCB72714.1 Protein N-acetyltransferase, RimJ/RimL family [Bifidobacterium bohemicum]
MTQGDSSTRVRVAVPADYETIMANYARARDLMARTGNPNQWGTSWPPADLVEQDIRQCRAMVLVDAEGGVERILAQFAMFEGAEPTYAHLAQGSWLDDAPYATMHRLASSGLRPHSARACLEWAVRQYGNVRCDTHPDNLAMQHVFETCGFTRCGTISVNDMGDRGHVRIVYQRHDR